MTVVDETSARTEGPGSEGAAGTARPALQAEGISKRYGPVQALAPTHLEVQRGEIHALVGENGSGKSTFVAIVSGVVAADTGSVLVAGQGLARSRPAASQAAGVLTVFQDGSLLPDLTVAQNLYTGTPRARRPRFAAIDTWAAALLSRYELSIDSRTLVSSLPAGDRQLLEIVRAVAAEPELLLLDEATSALDSDGVDRVLGLVRDAAAHGTAVLFVTHRLSEVFRVAHRVSVLRDGVLRATVPARDVDAKALVELMAGAKVAMEFPDRRPLDPAAPVVLEARGLRGPGLGPVDLQLHAGQIVGIAGAGGNGQPELLRALAKIGSPAGSVRLENAQLRGYRSAVDRGAILLSSDRRAESLFQALSIRENVVASTLPKISSLGIVRPRRERDYVAERITHFGVRLASPAQLPSELSGGNQQKVALSRVLATEPKVVLIDEPTQGVDVRSRLDIYRLLRDIADSGSCVVIVSSDASELAGFCDRVVVLSRGRVIAELPGLDASEDKIVHAFAVELVTTDDESTPTTTAPQTADAADPAPARARVRRRPRLGGDLLRLLALVVIIVAVSAYARSESSTFLTSLSIYNVLLLALPLIVVAAAQYCVLLVGGIDVSIGSVMSLAVVLVSFWASSSSTGLAIAGALAAALVGGVLVGLVNAWLIERRGLSPVIATIATLGLAAGVALVLRPTPAGTVSASLSDYLTDRLGFLPAPLIVIVVLLVAGDVALRRTGLGLRVRAVGLNGQFAYRLGTNTVLVRSSAYVVCAVLAALAGVLLAAQVGVGDPSTGTGYTLLAIAAPVLGGASLLGGRGSLIGTAFGAVLLVLAQSLVPVLGISDATSFLFTGGLTLLGLLVYSELWRGRRARSA
ncbi:ATP-binding cassette domain-containing protein [uncultured Jatrophihabitans sp.]|uniref:ATP-binding cassette domain-containing protein n=1 Tax=uncultured Jatrophihabitans sp. TaxID=1610747 RepID=UPI0035CB5674